MTTRHPQESTPVDPLLGADGLIEHIHGAKNAKGTHVGKAMAHLAARGRPTTGDIDRISAAAEAQRAALTYPAEPVPGVDADLNRDSTENDWSPSGVLETIPAQMGPDRHALQLPTHDRD